MTANRGGVRIAAALAAVLVVAAAGAVPAAGATTAPQSATATGDAAAASATETQDCEYPLEVTDATGTTVRIEEDPDEVVTMAPSAAQTMVEIGAWEEVVGVSQFASYLEGADERANISAPGIGNYNVERIVALQPDVVLAPNVVGDGTVEQLRSAGLTVVKFPAAGSIEDVAQKTRRIGQIVGACEGAERAVRWMNANVEAAREAVSGRERPKAVYVTGTYTTGAGTFINDMIETAGARNIFAEAGTTGFNPIDQEVVASEDPLWVVSTSPESDVLSREPYASTRAGQQGNLLAVNVNWLNQPAPRSVVFAVRNMTETFHPEAYGEADYVSREAVRNPTTTTTSGSTTADGGDDGTTMGTTASTAAGNGTTTAADGGSNATPGFGTPAALAALLAGLALLARRRRR